MQNNPGDPVDFLQRARAADKAALTELFTRYRDRPGDRSTRRRAGGILTVDS